MKSTVTKRWRQATAGAVLAAALVLVPAAAANAYVSKDGTRTCGSSAPNSWARGAGSGMLEIRAPGTHEYSLRNVGSGGAASVQGRYGGGYWDVRTTGTLSDSGTYAWCTNAA